MEAYTSFAQVYDLFMDNIPYDEWCEYLKDLLIKNNVKDGSLVLELGCGTGNVTRRLNQYGYNMIGIDNSEEMLMIARESLNENDRNNNATNETDNLATTVTNNNSNELDNSNEILYLLQDMREFELYGTVSAVVSICDSINYITDEEDLLQVFKLVNNYLEKDGVFIFDLNTEYKYKEILADNTIAENRDECSFIWDNYYYEDEQINEYQLTLYVKDNEEDIEDNVFRRYDEVHYQKAYSIETITRLIEKAGMSMVAVYDAFTYDKPTDKSERIYVIAKEGYQKNKKYKTN